MQLPSIELSQPPAHYPEGWLVPSVGSVENYRRSLKLGLVPTHAWALKQQAVEVPRDNIPGREVRRVADALLRIADAERAAGRRLAGLAAPQIGESVRIIAVDLSESRVEGDLTIIVNPRRVSRGRELEAASEGCMSQGPVTGVVTRPKQIRVLGFDTLGNWFFERPGGSQFVGSQARVMDHEIDHLNGTLAATQTIAEERPLLWLPAEHMPLYRGLAATGPDYLQEQWLLHCPPDQWQALYAGELLLDDFRLPNEVL